MKAMHHKCTRCGESFEPTTNRGRDVAWQSIFTRSIKLLPLGDDIQSLDQVRCPNCNHVEIATELPVFGVVPGKHIKLVLGTLFILILAFGYWLIRTFGR
jgi:DNA-directed RNA polymerase subunit RPC12/RpoP